MCSKNFQYFNGPFVNIKDLASNPAFGTFVNNDEILFSHSEDGKYNVEVIIERC